MPDNDDYLSRQLQLVSQQFGVTNTTDQPITNQQHADNINWKALYKVLESEVETIILDPNCPVYVKEWGQRIMQKLAEHLPRR
jgi:hypothetical protein|tara:strand:+ start:33 stop:281 length:249 start_codon:yes stop_codon:yes gene_type:complete